jgi:iron complex outermembrane receptor protein
MIGIRRRAGLCAAVVLGVGGMLPMRPARAADPEAPAVVEETESGETEAAEPAGGEGARARGGGIEEIVITAEKRETRLQTTPVAISAFTEGDLDSGGYEDLEDLAFAIPNVQFGRSFSGTGGVAIRGISSAQGDRSTAFHVDGVYRNEARPTDTLSFFDVQRVEVLRGPQGTLYGRNATGGSINVISNPPGPEVEAGGDVQLGTYDQIRTRAYLNLPIYEEKVMSRFALLHEVRDGFQHNGGTTRSRDADDEDVIAGRAQLRILPVPEVDLTLRTEHSSRDNIGIARKREGPFPRRFEVEGLPTRQTTFQEATPNPSDPRHIFLDEPGSTDQSDHSLNGTLTWDLYELPLLGDAELTVLGSWFEIDTQIVQDQDLSDAFISFSNIGRDATEWVGEARLASSGSYPLEWLFGVFYLKTDVDENIFARNRLQLFAGELIADELRDITEEAESIAGFARVSYTFFDELRLTGGVRYTHDEKDGSLEGDRLQTFLNAGGDVSEEVTCPFLRDAGSDAWDVVTGELRLDWQWSDDGLLYASGSRGYKAGTINNRILLDEANAPPLCDLLFSQGSLPAKADREIVWAAEIGSKNRFFGDRVQANLAAFYYDYDDIQFSQIIEQNIFTQNAATARVFGLEGEFVAVPFDDLPELRFIANVSYLNTEYTDFEDCTDPTDITRDIDCSGADLVQAPEWTVTGIVEYTRDLDRFGSLTPRAQFFASAGYTLLPFGNPEEEQGSYNKIDLRLTWRSADERFLVEGFVENIGDEDVKQTIVTGARQLGGGRQIIYDRPRTAGVRLGAEW